MMRHKEETKKQHWLPSSYLQFFTIDPDKQHRKGHLYRIDKEGHKRVEVETQGVSKFHYRRHNTHKSEGLFQVLESDYPELIRKATSKQLLSGNEQCKLLLSILALSCRNPSLTNQTGWENWDVFVSIGNSFLYNLLGAPPYADAQKLESQDLADLIKRSLKINPLPLDGTPPDEEFLRMAHVLRFIGSNFRATFIKTLKDSGSLFTSDFPTLFFSFDGITVPLMLLPVTPTLLAIVYNKRFFEVRHNWLSSKDLELLAELLLAQTDKALFASATPEDSLRAKSEALRNRKMRVQGWVKPDIWQPIMFSFTVLLEQKGGFDFLTLKE